MALKGTPARRKQAIAAQTDVSAPFTNGKPFIWNEESGKAITDNIATTAVEGLQDALDAKASETDTTTALAAKADASRTISTTEPLTGGGDMTANRTLGISPASGTAAG